MRWPRRGILIRLVIYVPLIAILGWRARGGCSEEATMEAEPTLEDKLAPHRRVIQLPDGTQQEIVELTPDEAEAILGHSIPDHVVEEAEAGGEAKGAAKAKGEAKAEGGAEAGGEAKTRGEAKAEGEAGAAGAARTEPGGAGG